MFLVFPCWYIWRRTLLSVASSNTRSVGWSHFLFFREKQREKRPNWHSLDWINYTSKWWQRLSNDKWNGLKTTRECRIIGKRLDPCCQGRKKISFVEQRNLRYPCHLLLFTCFPFNPCSDIRIANQWPALIVFYHEAGRKLEAWQAMIASPVSCEGYNKVKVCFLLPQGNPPKL